jgi:hypothetical protein
VKHRHRQAKVKPPELHQIVNRDQLGYLKLS